MCFLIQIQFFKFAALKFLRIDTQTAFIFDRAPSFPLPSDILPTINIQLPKSPPDQSLLDACITEEMVSAAKELLALTQYMISELAVRDLWDEGIFAGLHVVHLIYKFLSFRHNINECGTTLAREESFRLGALIYLGSIRQKSGVQFTAEIFVLKLKQAIIASALAEINPLLLWLLLLGGAQSLDCDGHGWFIRTTICAINRLEYLSWDELIACARRVSWVDGILNIECENFHREISTELFRVHGYSISHEIS